MLGGSFFGVPMINDAGVQEYKHLFWESDLFSSPSWNDFTFEDFLETVKSNELLHSVLYKEYGFPSLAEKIPWSEIDLSDIDIINDQQANEFLSDVASLNTDPRYIFVIIRKVLFRLSAMEDGSLEITHDQYRYSNMACLKELSTIFRELGRDEELGRILMNAATTEEDSEVDKHLKTILEVLTPEHLEFIRDAFTVRGKKLMEVMDRHNMMKSKDL